MSYLYHKQWLPHYHELTILEASRRASVYFLSLLADYWQNNSESPHILVDMRQSGLLPLLFLSKEILALAQCYPQQKSLELAFVLGSQEDANNCKYLLAYALKANRVAYFTELEAAHAWMMQQKPV